MTIISVTGGILGELIKSESSIVLFMFGNFFHGKLLLQVCKLLSEDGNT